MADTSTSSQRRRGAAPPPQSIRTDSAGPSREDVGTVVEQVSRERREQRWENEGGAARPPRPASG